MLSWYSYTLSISSKSNILLKRGQAIYQLLDVAGGEIVEVVVWTDSGLSGGGSLVEEAPRRQTE